MSSRFTDFTLRFARSAGRRLPRTLAAIAVATALAGGSGGLAAGCTVQSDDAPDGGARDDGGLSPDLRFTVEPADATLESADGSTPSVTLSVHAESITGERTDVTPLRWELAHDRIGTIDDGGTFTANGRAGGTVEVRAILPTPTPTTVSTTITVRLDVTVPADPSVPSDRIDDLEGLPEVEDPFGAVTLLYPLDGARMPNNVRAPDLQWHPIGGAGDVLRIVAASEHATVRAYVLHEGGGFQSRYRLPASAFRLIADSAGGGDVTLRVDRLPAGGDAVIPGTPVSIALSEDGLFGTLYYWQVELEPPASEIFRLNAATGERTSVFGNTGTSSDCVGCHTLSHDGRRLAATRSGPAGWYTTVVDAASEASPPPASLGPLTPAYHAVAWSPTGARALASRPLDTDRNDTRIYLLDGADGRELAASGLSTAPAGHPTWSPDGRLVAWMEGGGDGPDGTDAQTRIVIADAGADDTFDARVLHDGGDLELSPEGGLTDSHPTFSPDSRFVVFAHGTRSISSSTSDVERPRSALYIAPVEGGPALRLDRGMGPEGPVDAFWPVFSPFVTQEADGTVLYWLAFYSRQDYGNARAGTRGTRRRQIWLMAIDPELAGAGVDPSHPPYWIAGQDTAAEDIAAHWAPTACLAQGESCTASSECCSGHCAPDEFGLRCLPPETCRRAGESCETAGDCCGSSDCNLHVCGYEPPF